MAALASSVGSEDRLMQPFNSLRQKSPPSVCQNSPLLFRSIRLRKPRKQPRRIHRVVQSELSKAPSLPLSPSRRLLLLPLPLSMISKDRVSSFGVAAGLAASSRIIGLIALSDPRGPTRLPHLGVERPWCTHSNGDRRCACHSRYRSSRGRPAGANLPAGKPPDSIKPEDFSVFAGVLPEGNLTR